jgi:hypothetical protein
MLTARELKGVAQAIEMALKRQSWTEVITFLNVFFPQCQWYTGAIEGQKRILTRNNRRYFDPQWRKEHVKES